MRFVASEWPPGDVWEAFRCWQPARRENGWSDARWVADGRDVTSRGPNSTRPAMCGDVNRHRNCVS